MPHRQPVSAIRLLIVEDFHAETEIIIRELRDAELVHVVEIARSETAFERGVLDFKPDVILSPYSLIGTNAVKLLGLARSLGSDAPFILLAFDLSEDIAIDLLGEGVEDYVTRSTLKRLPVAIRKSLLRYKTQLELTLSEARLRTSEASLMEAQRIAKLGSWEWGVGTENVWWSEEMYRIYETDDPEIKLSDVRAFIHPEDREHVRKITDRDLNDDMTPVIEYRILLVSGKVKHVISSAKQIKDRHGKVVRLVGTLQDVTDQAVTKQAQDAERIQRELTVSASQIGVWHWLIEQNSLVWDERCYEIYGIDNRELQVEDFVNFLHPDDKQDVHERVLQAMRTGDYKAEYRITVDGAVKYLLAQGKTTFNEKMEPVRMDGIILNMTERHEMEMALKESEQLFRDMAESITEVFWLTDWALNEVLYVSPRYETLYGQPIEELYRDPTSWARSIHPDDFERATTQFRNLAAKGEYDEEYRLLMPDGSIKWVRDRAYPVFGVDGSVSRVAGITEEITDRKLSRRD